MIRDFASFTIRGMLADLERPAEIWGYILQTEQEGGETREETVEDRKTIDKPVVRVRGPKTQPHRGRCQ